MQHSQMEADIVVIGSGAAGLSAALSAARKGASVILFEKQPSFGGTSNFFQGMFAVESHMQVPQYIGYTRDQAFKNFMEYNHWRVNAALVRNLINKSADTIKWLENNGVVFSEVTINMPDAPRTYHVVKGTGEAVIKALVIQAKEAGVTMRSGAPVKSIRKGREGPTGVIAEIDGKDVTVECRAVIIASGGYANNKKWIKKYTGFDLDENVVPIGNVGKMGDGIRMAWEMGAGSEGIGVLHMLRAGPFGPDLPFMNTVEAVAIQPILWVDPQGKRFCDEGIAFYDTSTGNTNSRYKKGYTFSIFDDSLKHHYMKNGMDRGMGQLKLPGDKLESLDQELEELILRNTCHLFRGDTIEDLAVKMGVDPATLKNTVEQYNSFCDQHRDEQFAKEPRYLRPLVGPRYYAAKVRTCFMGTLGGIRINHLTEVVTAYDVPIPGLYAAGNDMGGVHAESYSMTDTSGATSAFAVISGRIAGEQAADYVERK
jgi:fumarate reductase flavoprotein subunit